METITMKNNIIDLPLMVENVDKSDIKEVIKFLDQDNIPILTNGPKVREFEAAWSKWLGVKHSVFINSGSAANELTMLALKYLYGEGEIIVPPLTWVSDVNSVLFSGHKLVFCDINLHNLSFDLDKLKNLINDKTRAIFLTHVLGINGLTDELLALCKEKNILLIEDVCESHGTTFKGQKVGSIGYASNFSFYFAHHMSTIEGGVVCTNDDKLYQVVRALRSHGMVRECTDEAFKENIIKDNPILNKDFIFIGPAHNFRSTEINAVIGLNQIKRLDNNNLKRVDNFDYFIKQLDSSKYITDFNIEGQCNYAFIVVLKEPSFELRDKIEATLREAKVEFRRGLSGGGNQTLQPYISKNFKIDQNNFPNVNHVHHFGWYIGNYPTLERSKIEQLIQLLNNTQ
jgi:CDP-6-deoxy-D-xylo-4-hexulose-3-dehydrase